MLNAYGKDPLKLSETTENSIVKINPYSVLDTQLLLEYIKRGEFIIIQWF